MVECSLISVYHALVVGKYLLSGIAILCSYLSHGVCVATVVPTKSDSGVYFVYNC